jgi:hypothetical protein
VDRHLAHSQPADGVLRPEAGRYKAFGPGHLRRTPRPGLGWRIDVTADGDKLRIVMHNLWPQEQGGREELAVEAEYARS